MSLAFARVAAAVGALGLVLCLLNGTVGLGSFFTDYIYPWTYVPAAVLCFLRALVAPRERVAWSAFGMGFLLWGGGYAYYGAYLNHADVPPFPSVADALWLPFYPVVYCGLVALVRARATDIRRSVWLDGLIGALALGALGAALLVDPILTATGGETAATLVTFAYPGGDLALLVVVLTVGAVRGWRLGRDWLLIAAALMIQVGADVYYVHSSVTGGYQLGSLLDSTWVLLSLMVAYAAWHPPNERNRAHVDDWHALAVPLVFTVLALLVLVLGNFQRFDDVVGEASAFLAAGALLAALARAGLTFGEKRRLDDVAKRDQLTGLLNHGAFHAALEREVAERGGSDGPFSLVMLDLDGFKEVNDLRGHAEGDRVLRTVAEVVRGTPRSSDPTGRLGGDEFGMLLRGVDGRSAVAVAERVRDGLKQRDLGIDVSYGIGEWPTDGPTKTMLLLRADTALYAVKKERASGRREEDPDDSDEHRRRGRSQAEVNERERELERAQLRAYAEDVRNSYTRELLRSQELRESYLATVKTMAAAVEAKDEYTGGHIQRVHAIGLLLARELVPASAKDAQLSYGFLLHDVGKLAVPDAVLNKAGKLTEDEWKLMKLHPEQGTAILSAVPFLGKALEVVRHHHERWDGAGYPDGLQGEEIPLWARIFAVVDTVDAITSDRPYRGAQSLDVAIAELRKGAGSQFDSACVEAFARVDRVELETLLEHRPDALPALNDVAMPEFSLEASG
ncbi:MAG: diguanylate cyclase [Solirubrobacteraceae bacterium]